jgi:hypothetical protein
MAVISTNFTKISAERKTGAKGKINIKNNVAITKVEKADLSIGSAKQPALKFDFEYNTKYEPKMGEMTILGDLVYLNTPEKIAEILDSWKKDKTVPKDIMPVILNNVLSKCNIEALILSRDINLPPPIQLPTVKVANK